MTSMEVVHDSPGPGPAWPAVGRWVAGFAVWTMLALVSSLQAAVFYASIDQPVPWRPVILLRFADWYSCALFTPLYFWMVRRWPIDRRRLATVVPLYLGVTAVVVVLKYAMFTPVANAINADLGRDAATLPEVLTRSFVPETLAFLCMLGIIQAIEYYRTLREGELRTARLQAQLADARLDALAAQLHPHFLFNTLQGVSTLMHRDTAAADVMLGRLSVLLRRTLQHEGAHEVPLRQELELLELYLGIVESRFADRLTVVRSVPAELDDALVPHFILQPLVENALHHGIARRAGAGRVEIAAWRDGADLVLEVSDDGPGIDPAMAGRNGEAVGLGNTRRRLAELYGERQRLEAGGSAGAGFRVTVRLPWHTDPLRRTEGR